MRAECSHPVAPLLAEAVTTKGRIDNRVFNGLKQPEIELAFVDTRSIILAHINEIEAGYPNTISFYHNAPLRADMTMSMLSGAM